MKFSRSFETILNVPVHHRTYFLSAILILVSAATLVLGQHHSGARKKVRSVRDAQSNSITITSIPFGETKGIDVYNASGVVPLGDSRFLFCDNNTNDAFLELDLTADGQKKGPLIRHPLNGLAVGAIDDMEAMTLAEKDGRQFVLATSSLSLKVDKKLRPSGLLRVTVNSEGSLTAENMPGFRDWFIGHAPAIASSAALTPDEGGLNIEGLAWDHHRDALLFGVRTPVSSNMPFVIPVRVRHLGGTWTTDNLEMLPPIRLSLEASEGEQGVRSIEYIPSRHSFFVIVGKAISGGKVPFALYEWNGDQRGQMRRLDVTFANKMKPEGVTSGTVGGKPVLLFVDDGGGYQVLWLDKTRL